MSQKIDYFSIVFQGFTWVVSSGKVFDINFINDKFDGSSKKFSLFLGQNVFWYILGCVKPYTVVPKVFRLCLCAPKPIH